MVDYFFGNMTYFAIGFRSPNIFRHGDQHYSSKLFITLRLQAQDAMISQPILLQLCGR